MTFLTDIVLKQLRGQGVRTIVDNLSAHKTEQVKPLLAERPDVEMHFTPIYSSRLDQVGLWIGRIERDVTVRGVFISGAVRLSCLSSPLSGWADRTVATRSTRGLDRQRAQLSRTRRSERVAKRRQLKVG